MSSKKNKDANKLRPHGFPDLLTRITISVKSVGPGFLCLQLFLDPITKITTGVKATRSVLLRRPPIQGKMLIRRTLNLKMLVNGLIGAIEGMRQSQETLNPTRKRNLSTLRGIKDFHLHLCVEPAQYPGAILTPRTRRP